MSSHHSALEVVLSQIPAPQAPLHEDNFQCRSIDIGALADGEILVRVIYTSVDPYMFQYALRDPQQFDKKVKSRAVGVVERSNLPEFPVGCFVFGSFGWATHSIEAPCSESRVFMADGSERKIAAADSVRRLDLPFLPGVVGASRLVRFLGILGGPGLTAYAGVSRFMRVAAGEQVFISSAAGAVGLAAGQIARALGAGRIVGSTGADSKVEFLKQHGYDDAFNYRAAIADNSAAYEAYHKALAQLFPDGIDCYFDNVGGPMLDAVLGLANQHARVAVCGIISTLEDDGVWQFRNFAQVLTKQIHIQGFQCRDNYDLFPEYSERMNRWLDAGEVKYQETVTQGIKSAPNALLSMLKGENLGKQLVQVSEDPTCLGAPPA